MKYCLCCTEAFEGQDDWLCPKCGFVPTLVDGFNTFSPDPALTGDGFNPSAFATLAQLEERNFWFCSRNQLITWAFERYFAGSRNFLEVGCGTGFVLSAIESHFPELLTSGSDLHSMGLRFASKRLARTHLFQMDSRQIPFKDEFDVIGAFDVLEHINEDRKALVQFYNALQPGGGLLLTVPQHRWLWSPADEFAHHERRYQRRELEQKLQDAGFEILRITSFVFFLLPAMMLSRWLAKRRSSKYDPESELSVALPLNAIMAATLAVERWLIRMGGSFPAGGSLLVVARKPE